jgi:hypothetical protein
MSLFTEPVRVVLSPALLAQFNDLKIGERSGGPQDVYRMVADRIQRFSDGHGEALLEEEELLKIRRYAYDYGGGGYQGVFRVVIGAARLAGWLEPEAEPKVVTRPAHLGRPWDGGKP